MNQLIDAMSQMNNITTTTNGATVYKSTKNPIVDFFYFIGGTTSGEQAIQKFDAAFEEDKDMAIRVLLYARDIRGGMGKRTIPRVILNHIATTYPLLAVALLPKIAELGRWDDLFAYFHTPVEENAVYFWCNALALGDNLAAKWAPREKSNKREYARKLRKMMGLKPDEYRKLIANHTSVVEQQMSAGDWSNINFSNVPSIAAARYQSAFSRNAPQEYTKYRDALLSGSPDVKINAGAIFPHTIIRSVTCGDSGIAEAQWNSLPDYLEGKNTKMLAMIDVSGSMHKKVEGNTTAMEVAIALGLYVSERSPSAFKNTFLTFDSTPAFVDLNGKSFVDRVFATSVADWGGSTNIYKAYQAILSAAIMNNVPADDMPEVMIIFSDMQFNAGVTTFGQSHHDSVVKMYTDAGYAAPAIVYWNLCGDSNVPVKVDEKGTMLVSGFSPSMMSTILSMDLDDVSPLALVKKAVENDRYGWMF